MSGRLLKGLRAAGFLPIAIVVLAGVVLAGGCSHPRATPEDTTAVVHEVSQTLVGRQITIRGKFASLTKGDPYVVLDNGQDVWIGPRETAMEETYSRMDGKLVEATGILRFYHAPDAKPGARAVQIPPDHFYFEPGTSQLRVISR